MSYVGAHTWRHTLARSRWAGIGALLLLFGVPLAFAHGWIDQSQLSQFGRYCCLAMVAIGLDLVWGYTGVLSLCQAMFFTLGGYAMGMYLAMHGPLDALYPACPIRGLQRYQRHASAVVLETFFLGCVCSFDGDPDSGYCRSYLRFFRIPQRIRGVYFSILTQAAYRRSLACCSVAMILQLCGTNGLTNFTHLFGLDLRETSTKVFLYELSAVLLVPPPQPRFG